MAQKVAKLVVDITTRLCEALQPGSLCSTANRIKRIQTRFSWMSDLSQKATSGRPWPIMLKFLPLMFLSIAQKVTHYAQ